MIFDTGSEKYKYPANHKIWKKIKIDIQRNKNLPYDNYLGNCTKELLKNRKTKEFVRSRVNEQYPANKDNKWIPIKKEIYKISSSKLITKSKWTHAWFREPDN